MIKNLLLFYTLILFCEISQAQEKEYIINYENDTIYGNVKRKMDYGHGKHNFNFKVKKQKKITIKPEEVKSFITIGGIDGNSYFESIDKEFFLKRIINGRIKLYITIGNSMGESGQYSFSKDNSEIKESSIGNTFSKKRAHTEIRELIMDKKEILKEFEELSGTKNNIKYIINKYNNSVN